MGVHGLVEWLIGGDDLRVGLKAQGKEQGVIHTPAVLHGQAVRRHEQGRAGGGGGKGSSRLHYCQGFDAEPGHRPKMGFVPRADEHTKPEMERGCGNGKIICGNEAALAAQCREEVSPALGDLGPELDDRDSRDQGSDFGAAARGAGWALRQPDTGQELRVDDGRQCGGFIPDDREGVSPGNR